MFLLQHRHLVYQLARREIVSRYRSSLLGLVWAVLQPLMMLGIYSFVFGYVLGARWPMEERSELFPLILFSGLLLHGLLAECLIRAPQLITQNPNFVKKVVFPLEILPLVMVCVSLFHCLIGLLLMLLALAALGIIHATALLIPLILLPFLFSALGFGWILAALGVYVRDISHLTGLLVTLLLFMSPILYPATMLPETVRPLMWLNPLTYPVETLRGLVLWGTLPSPSSYALYGIFSVSITALGYVFFRKARKGFADVL